MGGSRAAAGAGARDNRPAVLADVVLVGCVKSKRSHGAAAKDLYTSAYFSRMRTHAEATGLPWFIMSADSGLLEPDAWAEPNERCLFDLTRDERAHWGRTVAAQLEEVLGPLDGVVVDVHAGAAYIAWLDPPLRALGAVVLDQLSGLSLGRRMAWYRNAEGRPGPGR